MNAGYKQPPVEHRFKPGQSGNPKGRPKKPKLEPLKAADMPLQGQMQSEFYRLLTLQENGRPVELHAITALLRRMMVTAVKGDNRLAQRQVLQLIQEMEAAAAEQHAERYARYSRLKREGEAAFEKALKNGQPPPELYPHPADILIDPATCDVIIIGPYSDDELPLYRPGMLLRDLFLAFYAGVSGGLVDCAPENRSKLEAASVLMVEQINKTLPPSLQRTEGSIVGFIMDWQRLGKRQFPKKLKALNMELRSLPPQPKALLEERKQHRDVLLVLGESMMEAARQAAGHNGERCRGAQG